MDENIIVYTEILENIRELLGALFIQEQRNYDMLCIIGDKLGADSKGLYKLHESGQILAPAPSFMFEEEASPTDLQESLFEESIDNE